MTVPKCDYCGKFTKDFSIVQPPTMVYALEPADPLLVCQRCLKKLYHPDMDLPVASPEADDHSNHGLM